jgi:hypothetical protein
MTVVTPPPSSSDGDVQQSVQSPSNTTFEWKTLIETFNENTNSTKYNELVQSILRWFVYDMRKIKWNIYILFIFQGRSFESIRSNKWTVFEFICYSFHTLSCWRISTRFDKNPLLRWLIDFIFSWTFLFYRCDKCRKIVIKISFTKSFIENNRNKSSKYLWFLEKFSFDIDL